MNEDSFDPYSDAKAGSCVSFMIKTVDSHLSHKAIDALQKSSAK